MPRKREESKIEQHINDIKARYKEVYQELDKLIGYSEALRGTKKEPYYLTSMAFKRILTYIRQLHENLEEVMIQALKHEGELQKLRQKVAMKHEIKQLRAEIQTSMPRLERKSDDRLGE